MSNFNEEFESRGYFKIPDFLDTEGLARVKDELDRGSSTAAGDRRLLDHEWCQDLAASVRQVLRSRQLITGNYVATLCTFFDKSAETNWGVASHRDLSIPVKQRIEKDGWRNWSDKQGIPHVQPPKSLLLDMFAIRLNIDHSTLENGALLVSPFSHESDSYEAPSVVVGGPPGSALMMCPLIVHASRKSLDGSDRRVLHFLFGPEELEPPLEWFYAA